MKKKIADKIKYYEQQKNKFMDDYIDSGLKKDRDILLKVKTRIQVYKEVLQLIEE